MNVPFILTYDFSVTLLRYDELNTAILHKCICSIFFKCIVLQVLVFTVIYSYLLVVFQIDSKNKGFN